MKIVVVGPSPGVWALSVKYMYLFLMSMEGMTVRMEIYSCSACLRD
jgi:hypothetical protein